MIAAPINGFESIVESAALGAVGTTVTPANNGYGTAVQILSGAQVVDDVFKFEININSMAVSGSARDACVKVGVDPSGGSSPVDVIVDLLCGSAGGLGGTSGGGGVNYWFPLGIAAGSSIWVSASVNNATVGTCSVVCTVYGKPTGPVLPRRGSFVRTFGSAPGTSNGTAVTPGNGVASSFVQLGSNTVEPLWFWQLGVGINNAAQSNNQSAWDLWVGDSSNKRRVIASQLVIPSVAEAIAFSGKGAYLPTPTGSGAWTRAGGPAASSTGMSAAAYGMGG